MRPVRGATSYRALVLYRAYFNLMHPVRGATPLLHTSFNSFHYLFQSTHPAWGATCWTLTAPAPVPNFNQRTPHGVQQQNYTIQACLSST